MLIMPALDMVNFNLETSISALITPRNDVSLKKVYRRRIITLMLTECVNCPSGSGYSVLRIFQNLFIQEETYQIEF